MPIVGKEAQGRGQKWNVSTCDQVRRWRIEERRMEGCGQGRKGIGGNGRIREEVNNAAKKVEWSGIEEMECHAQTRKDPFEKEVTKQGPNGGGLEEVEGNQEENPKFELPKR